MISRLKTQLIVVVLTVVLLLSVCSVPVHADFGASVAASIFSMWAQSYGMSVGGATFGFSGVDSSEADSWITDTFNDWQSYEVQHGQSSAISLSDFVSSYSIYALTEKVFASSPTGSAYSTLLSIGSVLSEQLDDFWNWYLQSLGFVYDSASGWVNSLFSDDAPLMLYSVPTAGPIYVTSDNTYNSQWTYGGVKNTGKPFYVASTVTGTFCVSATFNGTPCFSFVTTTANANVYVYSNNNHAGGAMSGPYTYNGVDFYHRTFASNYPTVVFPSDNYSGSQLTDIGKKACEYVYGIMDGTIDNTGADISLKTHGDNEGDLEFPKSKDNPDYIPADVNIPLNIPWENTWDTLTQDELLEEVADDAQTKSLANELELVEPLDPPITPSGPSEVVVPFLPVNLPSFNFSLSGIWHYVIDWVESLGDWLQMMFYIWANLPLAMVLPVYATMVITIVVGLYRRFFM